MFEYWPLGKADASALLHFHQSPHGQLFAVVGLRGVPGGRSDALGRGGGGILVERRHRRGRESISMGRREGILVEKGRRGGILVVHTENSISNIVKFCISFIFCIFCARILHFSSKLSISVHFSIFRVQFLP